MLAAIAARSGALSSPPAPLAAHAAHAAGAPFVDATSARARTSRVFSTGARNHA